MTKVRTLSTKLNLTSVFLSSIRRMAGSSELLFLLIIKADAEAERLLTAKSVLKTAFILFLFLNASLNHKSI